MSDWRGTPLPSAGGDREVEYAKQTGKPVYYSEETLLARYPGGKIEVYPLYRVDVGEGLLPAIGRPFPWKPWRVDG